MGGEIVNYKYEFERLLFVAKQFTDYGEEFIKQGALAPFTALKNAVDYYENNQVSPSQSRKLNRLR